MDDIRKYINIISEAEMLESFTSDVTKRFGGKAKVWHIPYSDVKDETLGFFVIAYPPGIESKITRSLQDLERTSQYQLKITTGENLTKFSPYGVDSFKRALNWYNIPGFLESHPDWKTILIFFGPKEQQSTDQFPEMYHVTSNLNFAETGIVPQSTIKYQDRIYLWSDLDSALYFANYGFRREKTLALLYLRPAGEIYHDPEPAYGMEKFSYYTKTPIPPENIIKSQIINKQ
jgi:hypothetical protein